MISLIQITSLPRKEHDMLVCTQGEPQENLDKVSKHASAKSYQDSLPFSQAVRLFHSLNRRKKELQLTDQDLNEYTHTIYQKRFLLHTPLGRTRIYADVQQPQRE